MSCDERAAAEPRERAALARCLIKVADWHVRDDGAVLATMASRGSALRRRLESLLDDAPRRRRVVGPWLAVTTVAVPVVCLAPVVTIASLSRVPAAGHRRKHGAVIANVPFGDRNQAARERCAFVRFRGSPLVAAQLHGQPQPSRGHEIERLPPSQRANGGGDHQPDRVAADDVCRFMREKRTKLVVRKLAQRTDRHADFARERDRYAQRTAAR